MDKLPRRFGKSAVVRDFPMDAAREIIRWLSPSDAAIVGARFDGGQALVSDAHGGERPVGAGEETGGELEGIRAGLAGTSPRRTVSRSSAA